MPLETPTIVKSQKDAQARLRKLAELKQRKQELKGMLKECNSNVKKLKANLLEQR